MNKYKDYSKDNIRDLRIVWLGTYDRSLLYGCAYKRIVSLKSLIPVYLKTTKS